jgi:hypothetical protein
MATQQKLSELWRRDNIPLYATKGKKSAILSDLHLRDGGRADDTRSNEKIILAALRYYHKHHYSLILMGDVEEFGSLASKRSSLNTMIPSLKQ